MSISLYLVFSIFQFPYFSLLSSESTIVILTIKAFMTTSQE